MYKFNFINVFPINMNSRDAVVYIFYLIQKGLNVLENMPQ